MNRVLVTGAQGFVGRYLVQALLDTRAVEVMGTGRSAALARTFTHRITLADKLVPAPLPEAVRTSLATVRYRYVRADLLHAGSVERCLCEFQPDTIFHLASALRDEPLELLFGTNVLGTAALLQAVQESGIIVDRLILASSGAVYGHPSELPVSEDAPCRPADLYGASKLAAEHVSRVLCSHIGIPCIWSRLFNLVGAGQDERHVCGRLASQITAIKRGHAQPVLRVGNLDSTRDYIDIRDAAQALIEVAEKGILGSIYNVASGVETSVRRILECSLRVTELDGQVSIEQVRGRTGDIPRHYSDVSRLAALGYRRRYGLQDSLVEVMRYYLDHN